MVVYLDCNATTPVQPEVLEVVIRYMRDEYGNAGSRTHEFGTNAKRAVERAREQVAQVVGAKPEEVIFTSGATESNNLAVLGLRAEGERSGRKHIVSTQIEHKAILEPLEVLARAGFEITLVEPDSAGLVRPDRIRAALRPDTLLVSVMHVNNETGVIQPISRIAEALHGHDCYLHVDAAQGFGKVLEGIDSLRVDMVSISGHKVFAPKGIGALVLRRRAERRTPLSPLIVGGGQERGLRAGTLPTPLIVGLGQAAFLALRDRDTRHQFCAQMRREAIQAFTTIAADINGADEHCIAHTLNVSIPGVDSEAALVALKGMAALSNGAACTSSSYTQSHVLQAMRFDEARVAGALRFSWSHLTPNVPWREITSRLQRLM